MKKYLAVVLASLGLVACGGDSSSDSSPLYTSKEALGEALFSDVNLSMNRTQSCETCHNPDNAFVDTRTGTDGKIRAVSLGDDQLSLGDRNAPTITYANQTPEFQYGDVERINSQQDDYEGYFGGQFHDGRASTLADQAGGPPVNPIEMGMVDADGNADKPAVVDRLLENNDYVESFESLFGSDVFDDTDVAYAAMAEAIQAFEEQDDFATFDSGYDKYLDGDTTIYDPVLNTKAALGKTLFFSQQFTNCATCHQLKAQGKSGETFSSYEYHNIGVPANEAIRAESGIYDSEGSDYVDTGLQNNNSAVTDDSEKGKFKVPTLRNVAVTGPYMHNGVFTELDTVIRFYDHYLDGSENTLNPETGLAWADPEIEDNLNYTELEDGSLLDDDDVDALICFLRTLTDERYEDLLPDDGLCD